MYFLIYSLPVFLGICLGTKQNEAGRFLLIELESGRAEYDGWKSSEEDVLGPDSSLLALIGNLEVELFLVVRQQRS